MKPTLLLFSFLCCTPCFQTITKCEEEFYLKMLLVRQNKDVVLCYQEFDSVYNKVFEMKWFHLGE